jgi:hypothetical protein
MVVNDMLPFLSVLVQRTDVSKKHTTFSHQH